MFTTQQSHRLTIADLVSAPKLHSDPELTLIRTSTGWSNNYWIIQHGHPVADELDRRLETALGEGIYQHPDNIVITKNPVPLRWDQMLKVSRSMRVEPIEDDPIHDELTKGYEAVGDDQIQRGNIKGHVMFKRGDRAMSSRDYLTFMPNGVSYSVYLGTDGYYRVVGGDGEVILMIFSREY